MWRCDDNMGGLGEHMTCHILPCLSISFYIFVLWFLSIYVLLSFSSPNLSRRRLDVCHISTYGVASANLRWRSETWCTRLAANTGRKKIVKNLPSGHHFTTLSGYIFATKARIDNRKKLVKQQYLLHMSPQYGELRPTSTYCKPFKMRFFVQLCSSWLDFNWYSASRVPSATAELLVLSVVEPL